MNTKPTQQPLFSTFIDKGSMPANYDSALQQSFTSTQKSVQVVFEGIKKRIYDPNLLLADFNKATKKAYHFVGNAWENFYERTGVKRGICYNSSNNTSSLEACARRIASCAAHIPILDKSCCTFSECNPFSLQSTLSAVYKIHPFVNSSLLPEPSQASNSGLDWIGELLFTGLAFSIPCGLMIEQWKQGTIWATSIPLGAALGAGSSLIWGQNLTDTTKAAFKGALVQTAIDVPIAGLQAFYELEIGNRSPIKEFIKTYLPLIPFGAISLLYLGMPEYKHYSSAGPTAIASVTYMIGYKTLNPWIVYLSKKLMPVSSTVSVCFFAPITSYASLLPLETLSSIAIQHLRRRSIA